MAILSGKRLGPYEVLSAIGAGGMGEVYRARDTGLDRVVAVKILPDHLSDRAELACRYLRMGQKWLVGEMFSKRRYPQEHYAHSEQSSTAKPNAPNAALVDRTAAFPCWSKDGPGRTVSDAGSDSRQEARARREA